MENNQHFLTFVQVQGASDTHMHSTQSSHTWTITHTNPIITIQYASMEFTVMTKCCIINGGTVWFVMLSHPCGWAATVHNFSR